MSDSDKDFWLHNHGSLCILRPRNDAARAWVDRHIATDENAIWSGGGIVVEPRYLAPIIDGINEDGMSWVWM